MTVAILTGGLLFAGTGVSSANYTEVATYQSVAKATKSEKVPSLTQKEALNLFTKAQNSYWYVVMGGEGKRKEATFTQHDLEYRYMAESLSTMKKVKTYLEKTYTADQAAALIKKLRIIEHKGALAQPNADGGSILNFPKATLKESATTATTKKFTLHVPLGDTKEIQTLQGELRYEKGKGWRVYSLATVLNGDTAPKINTQQARSLFSEAHNSYWYVVMGGEGKRNEATFTHKGKDYRYMAENLNTMEKLKKYLGYIFTPEQQTKLIKELGIIEYKGALAQPNADGGSALNFEKAKLKEISASKNVKKFELNVPIGDSKETQAYKGELRYIKNADTWLVHHLVPKK